MKKNTDYIEFKPIMPANVNFVFAENADEIEFKMITEEKFICEGYIFKDENINSIKIIIKSDIFIMFEQDFIDFIYNYFIAKNLN